MPGQADLVASISGELSPGIADDQGLEGFAKEQQRSTSPDIQHLPAEATEPPGSSVDDKL